ncbi:hypothetical protein X777_10491 [Ooceraea biroi]|uniref:Uncharacterized protein n=1 Tax=Ooceraea biroi TaxID=2015173 RepID=A0A026W4B6_OOCBI|nr:hypothetical protein X777_10491 [Ooceraea biroi]
MTRRIGGSLFTGPSARPVRAIKIRTGVRPKRDDLRGTRARFFFVAGPYRIGFPVVSRVLEEGIQDHWQRVARVSTSPSILFCRMGNAHGNDDDDEDNDVPHAITALTVVNR